MRASPHSWRTGDRTIDRRAPPFYHGPVRVPEVEDESMTDAKLAGEIPSAEAWDLLKRDSGSVLVDVRTVAEWQFVGMPDLSEIGKQVMFQSWQVYPDMAVDDGFVDKVRAAGVRPDQTVLLMCRSGQRSRSAGLALAAAGFGRTYNVSDGFEGRLDEDGHRGRVEGWKAAGLPWVQR